MRAGKEYRGRPIMRAIIRTAPALFGHLPRPLAALAAKAEIALRPLWRRLLHPYRPEQHYMRGPGPKSRAKTTGSIDRPSGRTPRRLP
jgi:hypothetical protein